MKKSIFYQLDFAVQTLLLLFFVFTLIFGQYAFIYCLLFCQLFLGGWQLLSAVSWGVFVSDFNRGQFFFAAVIGLAGMSILLGMPEFKDSELLLLLGNFGAFAMMVAYYWQSFQDLNLDLPGRQLA